MDRKELYDTMASRKMKPKDFRPYANDNGRVNRCLSLMAHGKLKTGGRLIDVGGGIGDLGYGAKDLFYERIVVDICDKSNEAARAKGNTTYVLDVDRDGLTGLMDQTADLITALDFIEHIVDPENFARECFRVLKSGGEAFINTPNIRFWKHIEQLKYGGRFPHTSGDREVFHGGHLAFFTLSDLCDIFGDAGFTSFEQFKDDECFEAPPMPFLTGFNPKSQQEYVNLLMELGCPNLLFKAVKP